MSDDTTVDDVYPDDDTDDEELLDLFEVMNRGLARVLRRMQQSPEPQTKPKPTVH